MNLKKREKSFGFHKNQQIKSDSPAPLWLSTCQVRSRAWSPDRFNSDFAFSQNLFSLDVFFWDLDKGLSCLIDLSVKVRSTLTVPFALQPPLDLLRPLLVCPSRAPWKVLEQGRISQSESKSKILELGKTSWSSFTWCDNLGPVRQGGVVGQREGALRSCQHCLIAQFDDHQDNIKQIIIIRMTPFKQKSI